MDRALEICPPDVSFKDVAVDTPYEVVITVMNRGSSLTTARARLRPAATGLGFYIRGGEQKASLAPGLEMRVVVGFLCKELMPGTLIGELVVDTESTVDVVQISAIPPMVKFYVQKEVCFGSHISDGRVLKETVTICNDGAVPGKFTLSCSEGYPLVFKPDSGVVPPHGSMDIEMELTALHLGPQKERVTVYAANYQDSVAFDVVADLTEGKIAVLEETLDKPVEALIFKPTYFGTVRKLKVRLQNLRPEPLDYVVIIEADEAVNWSQAMCVTAALQTQVKNAGQTTVPHDHGDFDSKQPLLQIVPPHGCVPAFGEIILTAIFSPAFTRSQEGWHQSCIAPSPRDIPFHVKVAPTSSSMRSGTNGAEFAVVGHAIPVLLQVEPRGSMADHLEDKDISDAIDDNRVYDFGTCRVGRTVEVVFQLSNHSPVQSLHIQARRLAHFSFRKSSVILPPQGSSLFHVTFCPRQLGVFDVSLVLEVTDPEVSGRKPVIYELHTHLRGTGVSDDKKKIKPYIGTLLAGKWNSSVNAAAQYGSALETQPDAKMRTHYGTGARVAHPNEMKLARSIRPHPPADRVSVRFTGNARYTYIDRQYMYTDSEKEFKESVKEKYSGMIRPDHSKKFGATKKLRDPSQSLSKKDHTGRDNRDMSKGGYCKANLPPSKTAQLQQSALAERCLAAAERLVSPDSKPQSKKEEAECKRILSADERCLIVLETDSIDFKDVNVLSSKTHVVKVTNGTSSAVLFTAKASGDELAGCLPWQAIVPCQSSCLFTVSFKALSLGVFHRDIPYLLNGVPEHRIIVMANVVNPDLHLLPDPLHPFGGQNVRLYQTPGGAAGQGPSSSVALINKGNAVVPFSWSAKNDADALYWSIQPSIGEVVPHGVVHCEVVADPTFSSPLATEFLLNISSSSQKSLSCSLTLEEPDCVFLERRVQFGVIPMHLLSVQTCTLVNRGHIPAFFKASSVCRHEKSSLDVTPASGCVPGDGQIQLQVLFRPGKAMRFEGSINVSFRAGRKLSLKVWATVELPKVRLDRQDWLFGNVYANSTASLPVRVINDGTCRALVTFDLSKRRELRMKVLSENTAQHCIVGKAFRYNNRFTFELAGGESLACVAQFQFVGITTFDYTFGVEINEMLHYPDPEVSSSCATKAGMNGPRSKKAVTHPHRDGYRQPVCRVIATVVSPLISLIWLPKLSFNVPKGKLDKLPAFINKSVVAKNSSDRPLVLTLSKTELDDWSVRNGFVYLSPPTEVTGSVDNSASCQVSEMTMIPSAEGTFSVAFMPLVDQPNIESYDCTLNFKVRDEASQDNHAVDQVVESIRVSARLDSPRVTFSCAALHLTPAPLDTHTSSVFAAQCSGFKHDTRLNIELPIESEASECVVLLLDEEQSDNSEGIPVGHVVEWLDISASSMPCTFNLLLTFRSLSPVSISSSLTFVDVFSQEKYSLPIYAASDNSLLTVHSFLASNADRYDIVYAPDASDDEASLVDGASEHDKSSTLGEPSRKESLPITGSSITLRFHPGYGFAIDDAATITMVKSSIGNAIFTRSPSPYTDTQSSSCSFDTDSKSWLTGNSDLRLLSRASQQSGKEVDSLISAVATELSVISEKHSADTEDDTPFDSDPQRLLQEVMKLQPKVGAGNDETASDQLAVIQALERWFELYGWPDKRRRMCIPEDFRRGYRCPPEVPNPKITVSKGAPKAKKTTFTSARYPNLDDIVCHLAMKRIPGLPLDLALPGDVLERALHVKLHFSIIFQFLSSKGCLLSTIDVEDLLDFEEYAAIRMQQKDKETRKFLDYTGPPSRLTDPANFRSKVTELVRLKYHYEVASRNAWMVLLLQLVKVFHCDKITSKAVLSRGEPVKGMSADMLPGIDSVPSNVYSLGECNLLAWINHVFETNRLHLKSSQEGNANKQIEARWVTNFDSHLSDGLVLAVLLSAYAPFLMDSVLCSLYLKPTCDEQRWHNIMCVVGACQALCLEDVVEPCDMARPHAIRMLMFCTSLFDKLPRFLVKPTQSAIELNGSLGERVKGTVQLKNPSSRSVQYKLLLVGKDSSPFALEVTKITIPARGVEAVPLYYRCHYMAESTCTLLAVSQTQKVHAFTLRGSVSNIPVQTSTDCSVACYEQHVLKLRVKNSLHIEGLFQIIMCEQPVSLPQGLAASTVENTLQSAAMSRVSREGATAQFQSKNGEEKVVLPPIFWCRQTEVHLKANESADIEVEVIPLQPVSRYCSIVLACPSVGDIVFEVYADVHMPLPLAGPSLDETASLIRAPRRVRPSADLQATSAHAKDTLYLRCGGHERGFEEALHISSCNKARENAVALRQRWTLAPEERQRRAKLGMLLAPGCADHGYFTQVDDLQANQLVFSVTTNSEDVTVPDTFGVPFWKNTATSVAKHKHRIPDVSFGQVVPGTGQLPFSFLSKGASGLYPFRIILWHPDDVRVLRVEVGVSLPPTLMGDCIDVSAPTSTSVVRKIPVVNNTVQDWPLVATIIGRGFSGPSKMIAKARSTTQYPLTFHPLYLGSVEGLLTLIDTSDGRECCFKLAGDGTTPEPFRTMAVQSRVGEKTEVVVEVPNDADFAYKFKIEHNLPWLSCPDEVFVDANAKACVRLTCCPTKHGNFAADVSFTVDPGFSSFESEGSKSPLTSRKYMDFMETVKPSMPDQGKYLQLVRLNIKSRSAASQKTIKLATGVGTIAEHKFLIRNTTSATETYRAQFIGGRDLSGLKEIKVPFGETAEYAFYFSPQSLTKPTTSKLVMVPSGFDQQELHFTVVVHANSPDTIQLPCMEASLGRSTTCDLVVINPISVPLKLKPHLSNRRNFRLDFASIGLPSSQPIVLDVGKSVQIPLTFVPSKINCVVDCVVQFCCDEIGDISFSVSGKSLPPVPLDPVVMRSPIHGSSCHKITFSTPLDVEASASVALSLEEVPNLQELQVTTCLITRFSPDSLREEDDVELLLSDSMQMKPNTSLHIPVLFAPQSMAKRRAHVIITLQFKASGRLQTATWACALECIPMCNLAKPDHPYVMVAPVGVRSEQRFDLRLPIDLVSDCLQPLGAVNSDEPSQSKANTKHLKVALRSRSKRQDEHEQDTKMLERCAAVKLHHQASVGKDGGVDLTYEVIFVPSYEGWFEVMCVVMHDTLGEWHMPMSLHASRGNYDGVVHLELASLNQEMSVLLEVHNKLSAESPYQAFFSAGSHQGFAVRPAEGTLPPSSSSEGALLEVSFSPKIYRQPMEGVLIVKTDEQQMMYRVNALAMKPDVESQASQYAIRGPIPVPTRRNFMEENRTHLMKSVPARSKVTGTGR